MRTGTIEYLGKRDDPERQNGENQAWNDPAQDAAVDGQWTDPGGGSRSLEIQVARLEVMQEVRGQTNHQDP